MVGIGLIVTMDHGKQCYSGNLYDLCTPDGEDGLLQITGAKQEAEQIGKMQIESKEMAMKVLKACEETENFAHKLGETSDHLQELVTSLREQTGHVVEQGRSQKIVSDEAENAFLQSEVQTVG